jgi:hypothetical protein
VRSSAGIDVFFTSATPSVCKVRFGHLSSNVSFIAAGICTIDASQERHTVRVGPLVSPREVPPAKPEAQQSFKVYAPGTTNVKKRPRPR